MPHSHTMVLLPPRTTNVPHSYTNFRRQPMKCTQATPRPMQHTSGQAPSRPVCSRHLHHDALKVRPHTLLFLYIISTPRSAPGLTTVTRTSAFLPVTNGISAILVDAARPATFARRPACVAYPICSRRRRRFFFTELNHRRFRGDHRRLRQPLALVNSRGGRRGPGGRERVHHGSRLG